MWGISPSVFIAPLIVVMVCLVGLLWTRSVGRWPGGKIRANRIVRLLLLLLLMAANGSIGQIFGFLFACGEGLSGLVIIFAEIELLEAVWL